MVLTLRLVLGMASCCVFCLLAAGVHYESLHTYSVALDYLAFLVEQLDVHADA